MAHVGEKFAFGLVGGEGAFGHLLRAFCGLFQQIIGGGEGAIGLLQGEGALLNHFFQIAQPHAGLLIEPPFFGHGNRQLQRLDAVKRFFKITNRSE